MRGFTYFCDLCADPVDETSRRLVVNARKIDVCQSCQGKPISELLASPAMLAPARGQRSGADAAKTLAAIRERAAR